jgi:hypothetical protein
LATGEPAFVAGMLVPFVCVAGAAGGDWVVTFV